MTLVLRRAIADDSHDLWFWRNDEETRRNSRTMDVIPWQRHDEWYRARLENCRSQILIALYAGVRMGMICFDQIEKN